MMIINSVCRDIPITEMKDVLLHKNVVKTILAQVGGTMVDYETLGSDSDWSHEDVITRKCLF